MARYEVENGKLTVNVPYDYLSALESTFIRLGAIYRHGGIEDWAKELAQSGLGPVFRLGGYWLEFEHERALADNEAREAGVRG